MSIRLFYADSSDSAGLTALTHGHPTHGYVETRVVAATALAALLRNLNIGDAFAFSAAADVAEAGKLFDFNEPSITIDAHQAWCRIARRQAEIESVEDPDGPGGECPVVVDGALALGWGRTSVWLRRLPEGRVEVSVYSGPMAHAEWLTHERRLRLIGFKSNNRA